MISSIKIKLLAFDIDGVLTGGESTALDYELLGYLARLNRKARADPSCPAVTICSGRAAPYVELMVQAIDGHMPAIYENGAGLYFPANYSFRRNPVLQDGSLMIEIRHILQKGFVDSGYAFFQPGKEFTLTMYACDPGNIEKLQDKVTRALGPLAARVDILRSPSCVNLLPPGVDKSSGIQFLASQIHIDPAFMLGVGDSDIDITFLSLVGFSAAPANANPAVKSVVDYISDKSYGDGVRDIIVHFGISC